MFEAPKSVNELARLSSLASLKIMDTPPEERFDRYTRLARRVFGTSITLISLVDEDRQWFKSRQGLNATETARNISFCGHAITGKGTMVVEDALLDERFRDNPLVTSGPKIRFYAGCPIAAPDGNYVGTLCIIDQKPRTLNDEDLTVLSDLGALVEFELGSLMLATVDELTGLLNRRGFLIAATHSLAICKRQKQSACLLFFDLNGLKLINDNFGHSEGDRLLKEFSHLLVEAFRVSDVVARLGGDEYCLFLPGSTDREAGAALARLDLAIAARNAMPGESCQLNYSVGVVNFDPQRHDSLEELTNEADERMYEHKSASSGTLSRRS